MRQAMARGRQQVAAGVIAVVVALLLGDVAWAQAAGKSGAPDADGKATTTGPAPANGKADARARAKAAVERAQVDYKLGRFQDALDGYRRAYELYQAPLLLFDIAQCHRNLDDPEKAIFFFEGYLREETRPEPERRRLAEELITEARADLQRRMAATTVPAPASPPPPPPPARTLSL